MTLLSLTSPADSRYIISKTTGSGLQSPREDKPKMSFTWYVSTVSALPWRCRCENMKLLHWRERTRKHEFVLLRVEMDEAVSDWERERCADFYSYRDHSLWCRTFTCGIITEVVLLKRKPDFCQIVLFFRCLAPLQHSEGQSQSLFGNLIFNSYSDSTVPLYLGELTL